MRFFASYQYIAPLAFVPLSYWLWLRRYAGDQSMALAMLAVPIIFAYVLPAIGTNWLKLWEFNTRLRLGRMRPHHGFVFGSATSLFALLCLPRSAEPIGLVEVVRAGLVLGSVVAFWNWLYDVVALRAGFISVYNRRYAMGEGPEAIVTDYAPVFFGTFGACYGAFVRVAEAAMTQQGRPDLYWPILIVALLVSLTVPVGAFVLQSLWVHGETGLKSYEHESRRAA